MKFLTFMKRINKPIEYSSSVDVSDCAKLAVCDILEKLNSTHQIAEFTNDMKFDSRYVLYFENGNTYRHSDVKSLFAHAYDVSKSIIDISNDNSSVFIIRPFVYNGLGVLEDEQILLNVYWFTAEEIVNIYNKEYIASVRVLIDGKVKTIKVPVSLSHKASISFDISEIDENGVATVPVNGLLGGFSSSFNDIEDFFKVDYTLGEYSMRKKK